MKEEVNLQFRTLDDLWAFRIEAMVGYIAMDNKQNVLTCRCGANHVRLALSKYRAQVIVKDKPNQIEE